MPKFKSCNYDQPIMVPVNLQNQQVPGSLQFAISRSPALEFPLPARRFAIPGMPVLYVKRI